MYSKIARIRRGMDNRLGPALDAHFYITALEFKLGDVLFDQELNEFFQLFLVHCVR